MAVPEPVDLAEVERLFHQALTRPPTERQAFVAEASSANAALCSEVLSLLAADGQAEDFLAVPALTGCEADVEVHTQTRRIGPYRLARRLGEGGVSVVYLAGRADGHFQQEVAIKLIKPGMDTVEILRRFRQEQEILAGLNHPHIAKLFDGGRTDSGHPYFVLEYVEGEPIDRFCAAKKLSLAERLRLFCTVCSAVSYAHQNLIVHRDLKPNNILVPADGAVKLLDFGIAKLLNPDLAGRTLERTKTAYRLMTPHYASPEQVLGRPVTTTSDVYSLGVLLFLLLTGERPYDFESLEVREIERVVCESAPIAPSSVSGPTGPLRGAALPKDLDVIVLKAMRQEPQRRYGSAAALADDVERYLAGMPVTARKDTFGYRASKFVRRHVAAAAAVLVVIVSLVVGAVATAWQAEVANSERVRAEAQRQRAEQISDFLLTLFRVSDPRRPAPDEITARTLLGRGATRIRTELVRQPELQATLMHTMGVVYHNLGQFRDAAKLLNEALELRLAHLGPEHPDVAATLRQLGDATRELAIYPEAEKHFRQALQIRETSLGPDHPLTAEAMHSLAGFLMGFDRKESAELLQRALDIRRRSLGDEHVDVAVSLKGLAIWEHAFGSYGEAERLERQALAIARRALGDDHPEVARTLNDLAILRFYQGYLEDADALFGDALRRLQAVLGTRHPDVVDMHNSRAVVWRELGRYDEAEATHRWTLEERRRLRGEHHPAVDNGLNHLARLRYLKGDYAGARPLGERALVLRREKYGDLHRSVADSLAVVAAIDLASGQFAAAEVGFRRSMEIWSKVVGVQMPRRAEALDGLGATLLALGRRDEAAQVMQESLGLRRQTLRPGHPDIANSLVGLAQVRLSDAAAAEPLLREAARIREEAYPRGDWRAAQVDSLLSVCLWARDRQAEATELATSAYIRIRDTLGPDHPETRRAQDRMRN